MKARMMSLFHNDYPVAHFGKQYGRRGTAGPPADNQYVACRGG
jgi:hypothetical protein